jgi:UDP-N-acetylglucosamine/UDP-N-acetylgalactosamine 4-epimerase
MTRWTRWRAELRERPRRWLVTGAAGFIGSHLVESLLEQGQQVRGIDSFVTGHRANLEEIGRDRGEEAWSRFEFLEGDVRDGASCREACAGVDFVLHQAALGSVSRSIADPLATHASNVDGFLEMLLAARDARCARFVYASSSSVYGDHPDLPKREGVIGEPLSPYAATKRIDEIYAETIGRTFGLAVVGLRYFNVFGPRQDPDGAYAAVIPRWIGELLAGETPRIHGDGETSRDFCPVANAVQANLLAAASGPEAHGRSYNVALGARTTLDELFRLIRDGLAARGRDVGAVVAEHGEFRPGDVRHSLADLTRARELLGYSPEVDVAEGLRLTLDWFLKGRGGR